MKNYIIFSLILILICFSFNQMKGQLTTSFMGLTPKWQHRILGDNVPVRSDNDMIVNYDFDRAHALTQRKWNFIYDNSLVATQNIAANWFSGFNIIRLSVTDGQQIWQNTQYTPKLLDRKTMVRPIIKDDRLECIVMRDAPFPLMPLWNEGYLGAETYDLSDGILLAAAYTPKDNPEQKPFRIPVVFPALAPDQITSDAQLKDGNYNYISFRNINDFKDNTEESVFSTFYTDASEVGLDGNLVDKFNFSREKKGFTYIVRMFYKGADTIGRSITMEIPEQSGKVSYANEVEYMDYQGRLLDNGFKIEGRPHFSKVTTIEYNDTDRMILVSRDIDTNPTTTAYYTMTDYNGRIVKEAKSNYSQVIGINNSNVSEQVVNYKGEITVVRTSWPEKKKLLLQVLKSDNKGEMLVLKEIEMKLNIDSTLNFILARDAIVVGDDLLINLRRLNRNDNIIANEWVMIDGKDLGLISSTMQDHEQKMTVYPNPAQNYLELGNTDNILSLEVLDLKGSVLSKPDVSTRVDISSLIPGVYLLKIKYPTSENYMRIVKQ